MNRRIRYLVLASALLTQGLFLFVCAAHMGLLSVSPRRAANLAEVAALCFALPMNAYGVRRYYREHWHGLKPVEVLIMVAGAAFFPAAVWLLARRDVLEIGRLSLLTAEGASVMLLLLLGMDRAWSPEVDGPD